mmetsp:Transcript_2677/g.12088  ORF Transcript_2677/g.12088 Transcript_2677/m.12088 type:complete len:245 (-) Transcript_2677:1190-1924(-)
MRRAVVPCAYDRVALASRLVSWRSGTRGAASGNLRYHSAVEKRERTTPRTLPRRRHGEPRVARRRGHRGWRGGESRGRRHRRRGSRGVHRHQRRHLRGGRGRRGLHGLRLLIPLRRRLLQHAARRRRTVHLRRRRERPTGVEGVQLSGRARLGPRRQDRRRGERVAPSGKHDAGRYQESPLRRMARDETRSRRRPHRVQSGEGLLRRRRRYPRPAHRTVRHRPHDARAHRAKTGKLNGEFHRQR